jgi:hypothetical protein
MSRQIRSRAARATAELAAAEQETAEFDRIWDLARRHGVSTRTIDRWAETGLVPQPLRVNRLKFWKRGTTANFNASP